MDALVMLVAGSEGQPLRQQQQQGTVIASAM
jgi:hypothetical protein